LLADARDGVSKLFLSEQSANRRRWPRNEGRVTRREKRSRRMSKRFSRCSSAPSCPNLRLLLTICGLSVRFRRLNTFLRKIASYNSRHGPVRRRLLLGLRIVPEFGAINRTQGCTYVLTLGYQAKSLMKPPPHP
jgi:hypothetical protein